MVMVAGYIAIMGWTSFSGRACLNSFFCGFGFGVSEMNNYSDDIKTILSTIGFAAVLAVICTAGIVVISGLWLAGVVK